MLLEVTGDNFCHPVYHAMVVCCGNPEVEWYNMNELIDAFNICRERTDIRVVVLTGIGDKAFCSGGDQNVKGVGGYVGEDGVPRLNILDVHRQIRRVLFLTLQ